MKVHTQPGAVQAEFDSLRDHLDAYVSKPSPLPAPRSSQKPSRHISLLTQMAAKALHRDITGIAKPRGKKLNEGEKLEWDELSEYQTNETWKGVGLVKGLEDVDRVRTIGLSGAGGTARIEKRWSRSWDSDRMAGSVFARPCRW